MRLVPSANKQSVHSALHWRRDLGCLLSNWHDEKSILMPPKQTTDRGEHIHTYIYLCIWYMAKGIWYYAVWFEYSSWANGWGSPDAAASLMHSVAFLFTQKFIIYILFFTFVMLCVLSFKWFLTFAFFSLLAVCWGEQRSSGDWLLFALLSLPTRHFDYFLP